MLEREDFKQTSVTKFKSLREEFISAKRHEVYIRCFLTMNMLQQCQHLTFLVIIFSLSLSLSLSLSPFYIMKVQFALSKIKSLLKMKCNFNLKTYSKPSETQKC